MGIHEEQITCKSPMVLHIGGDVAADGETIGLRIERSEEGPVDLYLRSQDVKYLVSLLLNLGCEARRRQGHAGNDRPPSEAIPLPLDAISVGQSDDDHTFMMVEVGLTSLMFMLSPHHLEQIGQTMLLLSGKSPSSPS